MDLKPPHGCCTATCCARSVVVLNIHAGKEQDFYTHGVERLMPHMPLSAATVCAGYRYQRISTDFDQPDVQDAGDVTEGFAVGVNFSF